jgi:thioredoxin reductase
MNLFADDLTIYDSIIVGGGPAGLDAALRLGRSRDRVLLLDDEPHLFDGEAEERERRRRFERLLPYDVTVQACHVMRIDRHWPDLFAASSNNRTWFGRKIVIVNGRGERDVDPPGIIARLGGSPFRGGWEVRGDEQSAGGRT